MGKKYGWKDGYVSPARRRFWTLIPLAGVIAGAIMGRIYHSDVAIPAGFVGGLLLGFVVAAVRGRDEF